MDLHLKKLKHANGFLVDMRSDGISVISRIITHVSEPLQSSSIFKLDEIMFLK